MFYFIPETAGFHIPFFGEVSAVKWLLIFGGVFFVWALLPKLFESAASGFLSLVKKLFSALVKGAKTAFSKDGDVTTVDKPKPTESDDPLGSLQDLTKWAVHTGDSDTLSKVTPLFVELQKKIAVGAVLLASLITGCASYEPADVESRCGATAPPQDDAIQEANQSIRRQAPQFFE